MFDSILDWDSTISSNGKIILPEGDYTFEITQFDRDTFPGSDKLPACPVACIVMSIQYEGHSVEVKDRLYLVSRMQWRLVEFFRSLGLMGGYCGKMQWDCVLGAKGRCHLVVKTIENYDGSIGEYNVVETYYPYDEDAMRGDSSDDCVSTSYGEEFIDAPEDDLPF